MKDVVILGYARTPYGAFQGALSSLSATRLGAAAIQSALERSGVQADQVDEVIMGNVLTCGVGQAPCRQAAIYAGIPESVPCLTINKVCGSGMKSLMLATQSILLGDSDIVIAGGMENMSQAPHFLPNSRTGMRLGNQQILDSMVHDGLWDPYNQQHMGNCAELCSREHSISREEQDAFTKSSYERAQKAQKDSKFSKEICKVEVPGRKASVIVEEDEGPSQVDFERLSSLRPVFEKDGTVTAANASTINDGAGVLILASSEKAAELGIKPLAKLVSYASHAQTPQQFTTAPIEAIKKAIAKANWSIDGVDLFEINEAFAVVSLACQKGLGIPDDKLNIWGGAVSIGHPIGASGSRIVMTLISQLEDQNKSKGVAGICIGGGEATAVCIEKYS
ncbi:MAG: acetyl-CoA C-acyltransferase [Waddliaceae bacterium]|nr:acetyl-CoA C-acyltransferase [Waddliaceae bacterium]